MSKNKYYKEKTKISKKCKVCSKPFLTRRGSNNKSKEKETCSYRCSKIYYNYKKSREKLYLNDRGKFVVLTLKEFLNSMNR
jgi:hypothetical protein